MQIDTWPIGVVSFALEPSDFLRPLQVDRLQVSKALLDVIGEDGWTTSSVFVLDTPDPEPPADARTMKPIGP